MSSRKEFVFFLIGFSEPEKSFVILKEEGNHYSVNFTCYANEVYPAPKLILYKDRAHEFYNKYDGVCDKAGF